METTLAKKPRILAPGRRLQSLLEEGGRVMKGHLYSHDSFGQSKNIHRIRVLSRRQRALCRVLGASEPSSSEGLRRLEKGYRRLTRAFSAARSWDVSLGLLNDLAQEWESQGGQGLKFLRRIFRERRNKIRKRVWDKLPVKKIQKSLEWSEGEHWSDGFSDRALAEQLQERVGEASVRVLKKWGNFQKHRSLSRLHELRISWKKLRYGLEIQSKCLGFPDEATLDQFKLIQDRLGHIQDLRVLKGQLGEDGVRNKISKRKRSRFREFVKFLQFAIDREMNEFLQDTSADFEGLIPGGRS